MKSLLKILLFCLFLYTSAETFSGQEIEEVKKEQTKEAHYGAGTFQEAPTEDFLIHRVRKILVYMPGDTGDPDVYLPFVKMPYIEIRQCSFETCIHLIRRKIKDPQNRSLKYGIKNGQIIANFPNGKIPVGPGNDAILFTIKEGTTVIEAFYIMASIYFKDVPFILKYEKDTVGLEFLEK